MICFRNLLDNLIEVGLETIARLHTAANEQNSEESLPAKKCTKCFSLLFDCGSIDYRRKSRFFEVPAGVRLPVHQPDCGLVTRAPTCLESGDVQPRIGSVVTPPTVAVPHNQVETDGATKTYGCAVFGRPRKVVNGVPVPSQRGRGIQARLRATRDQWVTG